MACADQMMIFCLKITLGNDYVNSSSFTVENSDISVIPPGSSLDVSIKLKPNTNTTVNAQKLAIDILGGYWNAFFISTSPFSKHGCCFSKDIAFAWIPMYKEKEIRPFFSAITYLKQNDFWNRLSSRML